MRYDGSDTVLPIVFSSTLKQDFEAAHRARFSFIDTEKNIFIESVSAHVYGGSDPLQKMENTTAQNTFYTYAINNKVLHQG